jgi:serine/threonine protein kinase
MTDLALIALQQRLEGATCAEDVFGTDPGKVKKVYYQFAQVVHPDKHGTNASDAALAKELFFQINEWKNEAEAKVGSGTYGDRKRASPVKAADPIVVQTKRNVFVVSSPLEGEDIFSAYTCTVNGGAAGLFRVAKGQQFNPFLENEARVIQRLREGERPDSVFLKYTPQVVESFVSADRRRVNVLTLVESPDQYYSLAEVRAAYPNGVEPRVMAWMGRRMLEIVAYAHQKGVVHGSLVPTKFVIHPASHAGVIHDWTMSPEDDQPLRAVVKEYRAFYPPEVFEKKRLVPASDIYMWAKCMSFLLGGQPDNVLPESIPAPIARFLRSCLLAHPRYRPDDAWKLYDDFTEVLHKVFGKPKFHVFTMPAR